MEEPSSGGQPPPVDSGLLEHRQLIELVKFEEDNTGRDHEDVCMAGDVRSRVPAVLKSRWRLTAINRELSLDHGHFIAVRAVQELRERKFRAAVAGSHEGHVLHESHPHVTEEAGLGGVRGVAGGGYQAAGIRRDGPVVVVVGIGGPSGSGKSSLAAHLAQVLEGPIVGINLVDYSHPHSNCDDIHDVHALDVEALQADLQTLLKGREVHIPVFDAMERKRCGYQSVTLPAAASCVVIVKGVYALHERIRPFLDIGIAVVGGVHYALLQRVRSDVIRSGVHMTLAAVVDNVFPFFREHIEPTLSKAQIRISNCFLADSLRHPLFVLKHSSAVPEERVVSFFGASNVTRTVCRYVDVYLSPPHNPERTSEWIRVRQAGVRYFLSVGDQRIVDEASGFIVRPKAEFEIGKTTLNGLLQCSYAIAASFSRDSITFTPSSSPSPLATPGTSRSSTPPLSLPPTLHHPSAPGITRVCIDTIHYGNGESDSFTQVKGNDRQSVLSACQGLGLHPQWTTKPYVQLYLDKMGLPRLPTPPLSSSWVHFNHQEILDALSASTSSSTFIAIGHSDAALPGQLQQEVSSGDEAASSLPAGMPYSGHHQSLNIGVPPRSINARRGEGELHDDDAIDDMAPQPWTRSPTKASEAANLAVPASWTLTGGMSDSLLEGLMRTQVIQQAMAGSSTSSSTLPIPFSSHSINHDVNMPGTGIGQLPALYSTPPLEDHDTRNLLATSAGVPSSGPGASVPLSHQLAAAVAAQSAAAVAAATAVAASTAVAVSAAGMPAVLSQPAAPVPTADALAATAAGSTALASVLAASNATPAVPPEYRHPSPVPLDIRGLPRMEGSGGTVVPSSPHPGSEQQGGTSETTGRVPTASGPSDGRVQLGREELFQESGTGTAGEVEIEREAMGVGAMRSGEGVGGRAEPSSAAAVHAEDDVEPRRATTMLAAAEGSRERADADNVTAHHPRATLTQEQQVQHTRHVGALADTSHGGVGAGTVATASSGQQGDGGGGGGGGGGGRVRGFELEPKRGEFSFDRGLRLAVQAVQKLLHTNGAPVLVGIGGPNGSGKSSLASSLSSLIPSEVISLEHYLTPAADCTNSDDVAVLDWPLLRMNLEDLQEGRAASVPVYDGKEQRRKGYRTVIATGQIAAVILEGVHALHPCLQFRLDLRVAVDGGVHSHLIARVLSDLQQRSALSCDNPAHGSMTQSPIQGSMAQSPLHGSMAQSPLQGSIAQDLELLQEDQGDARETVDTALFSVHRLQTRPYLSSAHLRIVNNFDPFHSRDASMFVLKSAKQVSKEAILSLLDPQQTTSQQLSFTDMFLYLPGAHAQGPLRESDWIRVRCSANRFAILIREALCEGHFVVQPQVEFDVGLSTVAGLISLGYQPGLFMEVEATLYRNKQLSVEVDDIRGLNAHRFIQLKSATKEAVAAAGSALGLTGTYTTQPYVEIIHECNRVFFSESLNINRSREAARLNDLLVRASARLSSTTRSFQLSCITPAVPALTSSGSPALQGETRRIEAVPLLQRTASQQYDLESEKQRVQVQEREIQRLIEQLQALDGRIVALQRITMINTVLLSSILVCFCCFMFTHPK